MFKSNLFFTTSILVIFIYVLQWTGLFRFNNNQIIIDDNNVEVMPIDGGVVGPESFDFDPVDGSGPFTGVSDGRIIKWLANEQRWVDFAFMSTHREGCGKLDMEKICGRPLGLKWDKTRGDLYVADSYFGLLLVDPNGGLATSLVSKVHGEHLMFTNSLDIDQTNGLIYFTDSSQRYTRRDHTLVVLTNDKTGSLLKYDIESKEVTVLLENLSFPNGVALSQDGTFLLIAETTNCRVLRFWLKTPKAGKLEVFADLPGYPDNIKINQNGEFWVAMYSRKKTCLRWIQSIPWINNVLCKFPIDIVKVTSFVEKVGGEGLAAKLGDDGKILKILEDVNGKIWKFASEVLEKDGYLWIGSVENPFVVKLKIQD